MEAPKEIWHDGDSADAYKAELPGDTKYIRADVHQQKIKDLVAALVATNKWLEDIIQWTEDSYKQNSNRNRMVRQIRICIEDHQTAIQAAKS